MSTTSWSTPEPGTKLLSSSTPFLWSVDSWTPILQIIRITDKLWRMDVWITVVVHKTIMRHRWYIWQPTMKRKYQTWQATLAFWSYLTWLNDGVMLRHGWLTTPKRDYSIRQLVYWSHGQPEFVGRVVLFHWKWMDLDIGYKLGLCDMLINNVPVQLHLNLP